MFDLKGLTQALGDLEEDQVMEMLNEFAATNPSEEESLEAVGVCQAGVVSAVMDPLHRDMIGTIISTDALMGQDKHCRKYSKAFRAGQIGPIPK